MREPYPKIHTDLSGDGVIVYHCHHELSTHSAKSEATMRTALAKIETDGFIGDLARLKAYRQHLFKVELELAARGREHHIGPPPAYRPSVGEKFDMVALDIKA